MSLSQQTPRSIEIVPLTLHIGAEIRGVDLTKPLPPRALGKGTRSASLPASRSGVEQRNLIGSLDWIWATIVGDW